MPVSIDNATHPPNRCLEEVLRDRYRDVRRPTDKYNAPSDYGYALYFKSPVDYTFRGTWLVAAFEKRSSGADLTFSDDYLGLELRADEQARLVREIEETVNAVVSRCPVRRVPNSKATCDTFPLGKRCPMPR